MISVCTRSCIFTPNCICIGYFMPKSKYYYRKGVGAWCRYNVLTDFTVWLASAQYMVLAF